MKVRGEGREEDLTENGWTKYRMTSNIRDCRVMMCTTVLHGGVCHRTSTPHISGNKMKEKKKNHYHYIVRIRLLEYKTARSSSAIYSYITK